MVEQESGRKPDGRGNRVETTHKLLEAAAAEFVQRGYDGARVSDIARSAGVTVGSIYARWPSKTEMLVAALDHVLDPLLPEERLKGFGLFDFPLSDIMLLWGSRLLEPDSTQEVLTQVFGSARNNPEMQARLGNYINEQFDQMARLVERGKEEGLTDPEINTASIALLMQALGIGAHLVMAGGLDKDRAPSTSDWQAFLERVLDAFRPPSAD
ncbi:MAG: TetR/AcrR family transcriptional regulator [Acidimicrobiia bacterium]|nr:TetR/AcrR family transcriptional regulator [Acidimicrobiia bacterium]MYB72886.1 TetR/AcrR family transcriptional regulator [Acidimicrobiia bacterium]MYH99863.1 TetR/AcrR family transcriptional regulator [Acidimicrobiia bacterium]